MLTLLLTPFMASSMISIVLFCCIVLLYVLGRRKARLPLPPGPPAHPILGHIPVFPAKENRDDVFYQWAQQHGDVVHVNLLGKSIILLNSEQAAADLLDKRSANYSDRPAFPIYERVGWRDALAFMPYGPHFTRMRKTLQQPFNRGEVGKYLPVHEQEVNTLLKNLLEEPRDVDRHVHRYSIGFMMEILFGHRVASEDDEYFQMSEEIADILRAGARRTLLDISPLFEKLPTWLPGAWFVQYIRDIKPFLKNLIDFPIERIQRQMVQGNARPCVVAKHLEELEREGKLTAENTHDIKMIAQTTLGGGAETTWHGIMFFVACMMMNPEAQKRAQQEIDRVVGTGRLPDFGDRDSLPYVECVVQETMRWYPVAPIGVPHRAMEEDEYRGMRIPKGATVIANARSMALDARQFHEPHEFRPERFLPHPEGYGEVFSMNLVFGWGRRICPGRFLALNSVWLVAVRLLAVFNFQKPRDRDGNVIEQQLKIVTGLAAHPDRFECDVRPRSTKAAELALQAYDQLPPSDTSTTI